MLYDVELHGSLLPQYFQGDGFQQSFIKIQSQGNPTSAMSDSDSDQVTEAEQEQLSPSQSPQRRATSPAEEDSMAEDPSHDEYVLQMMNDGKDSLRK